MFTQGLSEQTQKNLAALGKIDFVNKYYLAGGTGLSLHIGHRFSHDLDFFSRLPVRPFVIQSHLRELGKLDVYQNTEGTFNGSLNGVKLSFFIYPYDLLTKPIKHSGVDVAEIVDIGCMKLDAVSSRGTKRDFVDLYFICSYQVQLRDLLQKLVQKYAEVEINIAHYLKSLVYFDDAEGDEMPEMIKPVDWEDIKKYFRKEIIEFTSKLSEK